MRVEQGGLAVAEHRVLVRGIPPWLDWQRLLGPGDWQWASPGQGALAATLLTDEAADVAERLRGLGVGGAAFEVEVTPPLGRPAVRRARTQEARRRRAKSAGLSRAGTRLDAEGHRSLTPEALALAIGRRARGRSVLDAGCGCGGNAIGFARAGCRVTAVEGSAERLAMARHNARLYGVADRIRFVHGDAVEVARRLDAQVLFVDPPWGGDYDRRRTTLSELPLLGELLPLAARFDAVWAKVPPSFDAAEIAGAVASAFFGEGEGDHRRIKFLLLELG